MNSNEHRKASRIRRIVCDYFGVDLFDVRVKCRVPQVAWPRSVAMRLVYEYTTLGWSECGRLFSRHHGAVIAGFKTCADREATNERDRIEIGSCRLKIVEDLLRRKEKAE